MGIKRLQCLVTDSEFFDKNWKRRGIKNLLWKLHETCLLDLLTGSGRPCTSCSCVVQRGAVTDWWHSWPMAITLASLCLSQRRTFWTYVVTINLFSLYLMNFMLHTMLDATGVEEFKFTTPSLLLLPGARARIGPVTESKCKWHSVP